MMMLFEVELAVTTFVVANDISSAKTIAKHALRTQVDDLGQWVFNV